MINLCTFYASMYLPLSKKIILFHQKYSKLNLQIAFVQIANNIVFIAMDVWKSKTRTTHFAIQTQEYFKSKQKTPIYSEEREVVFDFRDKISSNKQIQTNTNWVSITLKISPIFISWNFKQCTKPHKCKSHNSKCSHLSRLAIQHQKLITNENFVVYFFFLFSWDCFCFWQ